MPSEVIRCSDCGAVFKGVPSWLTTARVKFTCTNCPKRPSRGVARFEPAPVSLVTPDLDPKVALDDVDIDAVEIEEIDEEADLELAVDDLDDLKDDKEL